MPTDRVLVEIVTAFNSTGIKEAQAGFLGMSSALTASIAGLGLMVVAGRSAVDIAEKHEKAERDLAQAISARGGNLHEATTFLDEFIAANRTSISSQSEIINGYASLIRAGVSQTEAQKDANRALDIAAITGKSYEEVIQTLILAEHGRLRGLSDLGVTTTKFTDAEGNQVASSHDVAKALGEVDIATRKGRDSLTETDKASRALGNDWQDIANNVGPPLIGLLDAILQGTDWVIKNLKALGEDHTWNEALSAGFGQIQNFALPFLETVKGIIDGIQWLAGQGQGAGNPGQIASALRGNAFASYKGQGGKGGRIAAASGYEGTVSQPTLFLAGEAGSEDVSIRPQGGAGGAGHTINISIGTYVGNADQLSKMLAHELRLTGAFR